MNELQEISIWIWGLIAIALLAQSSFLFRDAQKRNLKPWFWGIWGLMQVPTPLIVYLIFRKIRDVRRKKNEERNSS